MVIVSTLSSSSLYLISGRIKIDYALFYACLGTISAIIGNLMINSYVSKTNKTSFLIYSLLGLMVFSLILAPLNAMITSLNESNDSFGFDGLCKN